LKAAYEDKDGLINYNGEKYAYEKNLGAGTYGSVILYVSKGRTGDPPALAVKRFQKYDEYKRDAEDPWNM
jgi:hypothetical protein